MSTKQRVEPPEPRPAECFVETWQLQLIGLGILLADKTLRDKVEVGDFCDLGMQAIVEGLKTGKAAVALEQLMRFVGVEGWTAKEGSPIPRILQRLRLDAETSKAIDRWYHVTKHLEGMTDAGKRAFCDAVWKGSKRPSLPPGQTGRSET